MTVGHPWRLLCRNRFAAGRLRIEIECGPSEPHQRAGDCRVIIECFMFLASPIFLGPEQAIHFSSAVVSSLNIPFTSESLD